MTKPQMTKSRLTMSRMTRLSMTMPSNDQRSRAPLGGPRPSAKYIREITKELAGLAHADGCDTLSYLLELATIEAEIMGGVPEGCLLS
jgi:hypothetical protein